MPSTRIYGLPYEHPQTDQPGITLHGGDPPSSPILAEEIERVARALDLRIADLEAKAALPVSGSRVATEIVTADSATFTTSETELVRVTAPLVAGRTYRVRGFGVFMSDDNGIDRVQVRIRPTSIGTTNIALINCYVIDSSTLGTPFMLETEFTAGSTGDQDFLLTALRNNGSGNINLIAASTRPAFLYVDYIRG